MLPFRCQFWEIGFWGLIYGWITLFLYVFYGKYDFYVKNILDLSLGSFVWILVILDGKSENQTPVDVGVCRVPPHKVSTTAIGNASFYLNF